MPETQHRPGVLTRIRKEPELKGVNEAPCMLLDLGERHRHKMVIVVDEAAFWKEFGFTLKVDGATVPLNQECRPEPEIVTKHLLGRPGSRYRQVLELIAWLNDVAAPQQVLEVMRRLMQPGS